MTATALGHTQVPEQAHERGSRRATPRTIPEAIGVLAFGTAGYLAWNARFGADAAAGATCFVRNHLGVPCPLCGGTTALIELGHGHLGAALASNPMVTVLAPIAVVLAVVFVGRCLGRIAGPAIWSAPTRLAAGLAGTALVIANWLWLVQRTG